MTIQEITDMSKADKIKMMGYFDEADINYMLCQVYNKDASIKIDIDCYLKLQRNNGLIDNGI